MPTTTSSCPCGSRKTLDQCCGRLISGDEHAITAEQLMRSRYSAYVMGEVNYLKSTWHPDSCPESLQLDDVRWLGLKVKHVTGGKADDTEGMVEFVARYKVNGRGFRLHEVSRFLKKDGRWFYLDGEYKSGE